MPKTHYPFALHKFTSDSDVPLIQAEYRGLLDFLVLKEQEIIENAFTQVIEKVMLDPDSIKGSVNRVGDKLGLSPIITEEDKTNHKHLYNFSEMVRANLTSLVGSYVQRAHLFDIITELPDADPKVIARAYKEITGKNVTRVQIEKLFNALKNTGSVDSLPSPPAKLPLWATDTHHCSLVQKGRTLSLHIKLDSGNHTLVFTIPSHVPISGVKFTRPTVMIGKKNRLVFSFTAEQYVDAPTSEVMGWLGCDAGIKNNYVITAVTENSISQSWSDTKQIQEISTRIRTLQSHVKYNQSKATLNEDTYPVRYAIQQSEIKHLRAKITRLKNYRAHLIANKIVSIAKHNNLGISLENLSWVPGSSWEQSLIQTKIKDEATRARVKVKKVSAKHTSTTCSRCQSKDTTFSGRTLLCKSCDHRADRDVNASINIALRALGLKHCPPYYHRWQTRSTTVTANPKQVPFVESSTIFTNSNPAIRSPARI